MRAGALLLAAQALLLAALAGPARAEPVQLLEAPLGLAWSPDEVAAAGRPALDAVLQQARAASALGCRTHCLLIHDVWRRLQPVFAKQQAGRRTRFPLALYVVQLDGAAFALPDGSVVLSEAFVRGSGLDAPQLAFVLSHEVAHVLQEHERQTLTTALALLPRNVPRTVPDIYTEMAYNFGLLKALEPSLRQVEFEADEVGLQLAALAGYAPRRQLAFMEHEAASERPQGAVLATHPSAQERLMRLQALLPLARGVYARGRR